MRRADQMRLLAAVEAVAKEIRASIKTEAAEEFERTGMAASWRADGVLVTSSVEHDRVEVVDPDAFLSWLVDEHPDQVQTVVQPRNPAWVKEILAKAALLGPVKPDPLAEPGKQLPSVAAIPGTVYVKGGRFDTISVRVDGGAKRQLAALAREAIATGAVSPELAEVFHGQYALEEGV